MDKFYKFKEWPSLSKDEYPSDQVERSRVESIVQQQKIYAPKFLQLNDPFEGNLLAINHPNITELYDHDDVELFSEQLHLLDKEWLEKLDRHRVLSVCTDSGGQKDKGWKNPLMWSHYADKHTGVCFEITFNPDNLPIKMKYLKNTKELSKYIGSSRSPLKALNAKFDCWKYENEYRLVVSESTEYIPIKISEIILGFNMSRIDREYWQKFSKDHKIEISKAILTDNGIDKTRSESFIERDNIYQSYTKEMGQ